ncbi:MAG: hypothetical protein ACYC6W_06990 [Nitrosotalea sp.]
MKEQFKVSKVAIVNNKFNLTVQNTGEIPINITHIYVQNTTATDWFGKYSVNSAISPTSTVTNVGMNIPLSAISTKSYNIKLVTDRGNSQDVLIRSTSSSPIPLQLFILPSSVPSGFTINVLLGVTNNMTTSVALANVEPVISIISGGASATYVSGPQPTSYDTIPNGNTVYFQWTYQISGSTGSSITFNATLQNAYPGNYVTSQVTIQNVQFSDQSLNSMTSKGLTALSTFDNLLIFHKETTDSLNGYQMYSVNPDATGQIIQLDSTTPTFYTNNDTVSANIPAGQWNATLRYLSSPVPSSIPNGNLPDLIYHFESSGSTTKDSSGNGDDLTVNGAVFSSGTGVNNTNVFTFTPNQYMSRAVDSHSNIDATAFNFASTALWFKTSGSVTTKQVLVRMGDTSSKPFYEISVLNHKIYFQFGNEKNSGAVDAACTGSKIVDNQNWHHLIVEKTGAGTCKLYVDGNSDGSQTTTTFGCSGTGCAAVSGNWAVARDSSGPGSYFSGRIDDVLHWNNYALSSSQVTDLYNTSYGKSAHKLTFTVDMVDQNGNFVRHINTTSISNYPFNFQDSFGTYSSISASSTTWGSQNFTFNAPVVNVASNQRIKFQIAFVPPVNGQLPMKFDIDNSLISTSSSLQIPLPDNPLPGYFVCNQCTTQDGTVNVYNQGPYAAWLTQNSRVTFETYDGKSVYASWVTGFSGFSHGVSADSTVMLVGTSLPITFSIPHTGPGIDPSGNSGAYGSIIMPGHYRMYVFLNGYDQKGNVLLGTEYIGPVKVT